MSKVDASPERFQKVLGFDPARRQNLTQDLFKELLDEAQKDRLEKAKEAARGKLRKLMELREQVVALEKKFNGERQKFDKQIHSLFNEIEGSLSGRPAPTEDSESEETSDAQ